MLGPESVCAEWSVGVVAEMRARREGGGRGKNTPEVCGSSGLFWGEVSRLWTGFTGALGRRGRALPCPFWGERRAFLHHPRGPF